MLHSCISLYYTTFVTWRMLTPPFFIFVCCTQSLNQTHTLLKGTVCNPARKVTHTLPQDVLDINTHNQMFSPGT